MDIMLFKDIVTSYGNSLSGKVLKPLADMVYDLSPRELRDPFRQQVVDDLKDARIYVLDTEVANYADSLRESLQDYRFDDTGTDIANQRMREISILHDIMWVEYDHRDIIRNRVARGYTINGVLNGQTNIYQFIGRRGFLLDNRHPDKLKVTMFDELGSEALIDPLLNLEFKKDESGLINFETYRLNLHEHVGHFYEATGATLDEMQNGLRISMTETSNDMALSFMLMSLLGSTENSLIVDERETLSPNDRKTACKFGRAWINDVLRTHVTIRIGDEGRAHIKELTERRAYEREVAEGRRPPIEHRVAEHERRYKSGKVVMVRAHVRGQKLDPLIPTLVKGPRRMHYAADNRLSI
jgi:hypothetical protein